MQPKFKVWVTFGDETKFGDGRASLLQTIDEVGSINKAVKKFGMSYRTAWGYIQELEQSAGFELLHRSPGGGVEGGTRLTPKGREFLKGYRQFRRGLDGIISRKFKAAFRKPNRERKRVR